MFSGKENSVQIKDLLSLKTPEVQRFLREHEHVDETTLILRGASIYGIPPAMIAGQINARRKARLKIPEFYNSDKIIYPPGINLEQCSSEKTARYKSQLMQKLAGSTETLVDLTGGFGVDSFFFSKVFSRVIYIEPDEQLLCIARENHRELGAANIDHVCSSAENFLSSFSSPVSAMYLDPSRRVDGKRAFTFNDCSPDVTRLVPRILDCCDTIMVKGAPLLDLKSGLQSLPETKLMYIVAVQNEVKELLYVLKPENGGAPLITAVDLQEPFNELSFTFNKESEQRSTFSPPEKYLYEPNAAILKAGAFKLVGSRYDLKKLHPNTHLYTSSGQVPGFPGRIFFIREELKFSKSERDRLFQDGKANVICRNYPLSAAELQKRLRLKDGGDKYVVAATSIDRKVVLLCDRLK